MKPYLCLITIASVVACLPVACRAEDKREDKPRFKGVELYSWKEKKGDWAFAILTGTNRLKAEAEVKAAKNRIQGTGHLEQAIARLAEGEQVFWSHHVKGFEFPPVPMRVEIAKAAKAVKVTVHVPRPGDGEPETLWDDNKFTQEQPWPGKVISVKSSWLGYNLLITDLKTSSKLCSVAIDGFGTITYRELKGEAKKAALAVPRRSDSYGTIGVVHLSPGVEIGVFSWSIGPQTLGKLFENRDLLLIASKRQREQGMSRARRVQPPRHVPLGR